MNDLSAYQQGQLPDNLEDLAKYTIVGRERLKAVKAAITAIDRVGLAKDVHEQKLREAQELAEVVIDAETRLGELIGEIPKASGQYAESENRPMSKNTFMSGLGISKDQASQFQRMARNKEAVETAKALARERGDVVSRQSAMRIIAANTPEPERKPSGALEAKARHEDFKQKTTVSMDEVMQDREDKQTIARDLYKDLLSLTQKSYWIGAMNKAEDFERVAKIATDRELFAERIRKMIAVLNKLLECL